MTSDELEKAKQAIVVALRDLKRLRRLATYDELRERTLEVFAGWHGGMPRDIRWDTLFAAAIGAAADDGTVEVTKQRPRRVRMIHTERSSYRGSSEPRSR
jgi:hypothetical protein